MTFPACLRPSFARLVMVFLGSAPGLSSLMAAGDEPHPVPSPAPAAITDQRRATIEALRELDRFLDHHPLIEVDLRLESCLLESPAYVERHPALHQFLTTNPEVGPVLQTEPRHLLRRALRREANTPLRWSDVIRLDAFFDQNAAVEQQLVRNPALILTPGFLAAEPKLREFLAQDAALARGFLPAASTP